MDIDDTRPVKKPDIAIGESLDLLVGCRIGTPNLDFGIRDRPHPRHLIGQKLAGKAAADAVFRR